LVLDQWLKMAISENINTVLSKYMVPAFEGVASLGVIRAERALAKGLHEQRHSCSLNWIASIYSFMNKSKGNVEAIFSKSFSKRFSYLGMTSLVVIPALQIASECLEDSDYTYTKRAVDVIYRGVPDLILLASIVQYSVALYFGVLPAQNAIYLTSSLWGLLEQGLYTITQKENGGWLYTYFDGKIISAYDPCVNKIKKVGIFILSYKYDGIIGKIFCVCMIPPKLLSPILSRVNKFMPKQEGVKIRPVPESIPNIWHSKMELFPRDRNYEITEKHFLPLEIADQFPDESLEALHKQVQDLLVKDTQLEKEKKKQLTELLGTEGEKGVLLSAIPVKGGELRREFIIELKNILGLLASDWNRYKSSLLTKYESLVLCEASELKGIKDLHLELLPEIDKTKKSSFNEGKLDIRQLEKNRLDIQIQRILQMKRDDLWLQMNQMTFHSSTITKAISWVIDRHSENALNEQHLLLCNSVIGKLGYYFMRCIHGLKYYFLRCVQGLWLSLPVKYLLHPFFDDFATNLHQVNVIKGVNGKRLGLSDYKIALADLHQTIGAPILEEVAPLERVFINKYAKSWFEDLVEVIVNPEDERLKIQDFCGMIHHLAPNEDDKEAISKEFVAMYEGRDLNLARAKLFVQKYLPILLLNTGFLV
jgi:hypothetical protein